jgi:hypothetical protein
LNLLVWRGPVHGSARPHAVIERLITEAGLVPRFSKTTGPWQVAVYCRR